MCDCLIERKGKIDTVEVHGKARDIHQVDVKRCPECAAYEQRRDSYIARAEKHANRLAVQTAFASVEEKRTAWTRNFATHMNFLSTKDQREISIKKMEQEASDLMRRAAELRAANG